jgi:hypothetical protein
MAALEAPNVEAVRIPGDEDRRRRKGNRGNRAALELM